ncbi:MAG: succinyl-diaminopimelate desuccinylase [Actinobacteria bacterium]|uniref:Unannotated protein n=1 Tax=freshwater metagenome TaxID=449393 RepID=A0A6J6QCG0_9ZZZZ|nr:succinyl-diaminopimelate desuccinylase [Actinomycetota bacterium]
MPGQTPHPDLGARTLALVNIPSESLHEQEAYSYVKRAMPFAPAFDDGESLLYLLQSERPRPLVILAGHTDTVPAQDNIPGRIEDGVVFGLGSTDMKGGLAVMIEIADWALGAERAYDLGFLFFPREELGADVNPLPAVFERNPVIDTAALVICLEPTDNTLQLGCLGNLNARLVFEGKAAHSARPWQGENAIAKAFAGLADILTLEPNDVVIDGLLFREVLSVTKIQGGTASNVIPARVECTLNFRYAPNRSAEEAEARLRELAGPSVEVLHNSPSAHVAQGSQVLDALRRAGDFELQPKQAWTNVADFAARGLDAVNLGPGATKYAHKADEQVSVAALEDTYRSLQRFLAGEA